MDLQSYNNFPSREEFVADLSLHTDYHVPNGKNSFIVCHNRLTENGLGTRTEQFYKYGKVYSTTKRTFLPENSRLVRGENGIDSFEYYVKEAPYKRDIRAISKDGKTLALGREGVKSLIKKIKKS